jgi:Cyclic nucleotide-binding domain/Major Facilitator Superfamily
VRDVIVSLTHNRRILRVVCAYALFTVNEYSVWIAILVYAYERGGATETGVIAVVQLVPAGLCAPFMAVRADRSSPSVLLVGGFIAQIAGLALAAVAIFAGWPSADVYAGAILAATAITAARPAQAALLPSLARTPDELTAANVVMSWLESIGVALAGVWAAALLTRGVGEVLVAAIVLLTVALWLVALDARRDGPRAEDSDETSSTWADVVDGSHAVRKAPGAGTLIALLGAQDVVLGALDVLFVIVAIGVLHRSQSWVGYLNGAYGLGGVLIGAAMFLLIGRRLPVPILTSSILLGLCIALIPINGSAAMAVVLLGAVGAARGVMDMSTRTLLQRSVAPDVLGRVFGLVEGLTMLSVAAGSMLVPLLVLIGGPDAALIGVGCILPAIAILSAGRLLRLDADSRIPLVEIELLRSVDVFASLPPSVIESLARALVPVRLDTGDVLIREGDHGDAYFSVADGRFAVSQTGRVLTEVGRGVGIGEIALLQDVPRTATVTALRPSLVYSLPREMFLDAITGHAPAQSVAQAKIARTFTEDDMRLGVRVPW